MELLSRQAKKTFLNLLVWSGGLKMQLDFWLNAETWGMRKRQKVNSPRKSLEKEDGTHLLLNNQTKQRREPSS